MLKILTAILLIFVGASFNRLHLKADLIYDRGGLNGHGTYLSYADKDKLRVFDKYAGMDLSGFKLSKHTSGRHIVTTWTEGKKIIYEIKSILPAAPTYETKSVETGKVTTKINPYRGTFTFRTYIINFPNQHRLVYQTQVNEGLLYYSIGKEKYSPLREDIALGVNYPNEKEITDLVN